MYSVHSVVKIISTPAIPLIFLPKIFLSEIFTQPKLVRRSLLDHRSLGEGGGEVGSPHLLFSVSSIFLLFSKTSSLPVKNARYISTCNLEVAPNVGT